MPAYFSKGGQKVPSGLFAVTAVNLFHLHNRHRITSRIRQQERSVPDATVASSQITFSFPQFVQNEKRAAPWQTDTQRTNHLGLGFLTDRQWGFARFLVLKQGIGQCKAQSSRLSF